MKKAVTVCDSCGRVIRDGSDHFPIHPKRLLYEYQTRDESYVKLRLPSEPYYDGMGERDQEVLVIDLCYLCASTRLIPALEEIARSLASKSAEKPQAG